MRQLGRLLLLLSIFLGFHSSLFADTYYRERGREHQENSSATTILFVNGIRNTLNSTGVSSEQLIQAMKVSGLPQLKYNFEYFYNPTDGKYGVGDETELIVQALISDAALASSGGDRNAYYLALGQFYNSQYAVVATLSGVRKRVASVAGLLKGTVESYLAGSAGLVIVPHSQGNFYVEAAYAMLYAEDKFALLDRIRVVGVASVAATSPNSRYLTHTEDEAVQLQELQTHNTLVSLQKYHVLPANETACMVGLCADNILWDLIDKRRHGFTQVYLNIDLQSQVSGISFPEIIYGYVTTSLAELQPSPTRALYSITPLGDARPTAINDRGDIVGTCGQVACIRRAADRTWRSIGTLGGHESMPLAIDSTGRVVGSSATEPSVGTHAFRYSGILGSPLVDITKEFVGNETILASQAVSIADSGFIAGNVTLGTLFTHAFLSINGVGQDLGTLPGTSASYAAKVNNAGTVVGYSNSVGGLPSAFIRPPGATGMSEIPQLSGRLSTAMDINSAGTVVGIQWPGKSIADPYYGFIYSKNPQTGVETFTDIKDINNQFVLVNAVNNLGEVVGTKSSGAFVYSNGTLRDLNQLLPANSGWFIDGGTTINNLGQIIGQGLLNGQRQAVLLTPVQ